MNGYVNSQLITVHCSPLTVHCKECENVVKFIILLILLIGTLDALIIFIVFRSISERRKEVHRLFELRGFRMISKEDVLWKKLSKASQIMLNIRMTLPNFNFFAEVAEGVYFFEIVVSSRYNSWTYYGLIESVGSELRSLVNFSIRKRNPVFRLFSRTDDTFYRDFKVTPEGFIDRLSNSVILKDFIKTSGEINIAKNEEYFVIYQVFQKKLKTNDLVHKAQELLEKRENILRLLSVSDF